MLWGIFKSSWTPGSISNHKNVGTFSSISPWVIQWKMDRQKKNWYTIIYYIQIFWAIDRKDCTVQLKWTAVMMITQRLPS